MSCNRHAFEWAGPRKKLKTGETKQYELARRLEEYKEYAIATKRFADVGFYEELLDYIEPDYDEQRIDVIGSNGNDGEHYDRPEGGSTQAEGGKTGAGEGTDRCSGRPDPDG